MLSKNAMYLQKRDKLLKQHKEHFVYNIKCENNNKIYIGQNIDLYKWFKEHMGRPHMKMKHALI
jgi:predicted GIY-YIG superfamily endonuclease